MSPVYKYSCKHTISPSLSADKKPQRRTLKCQPRWIQWNDSRKTRANRELSSMCSYPRPSGWTQSPSWQTSCTLGWGGWQSQHILPDSFVAGREREKNANVKNKTCTDSILQPCVKCIAKKTVITHSHIAVTDTPGLFTTWTSLFPMQRFLSHLSICLQQLPQYQHWPQYGFSISTQNG